MLNLVDFFTILYNYLLRFIANFELVANCKKMCFYVITINLQSPTALWIKQAKDTLRKKMLKNCQSMHIK